MSTEAAASVLALLIFATLVYVIHTRIRTGEWPKWPFKK